MRSLNGQNYTVLFIAKPMPSDVPSQKLNELLTIRDQCFAVSKRNISRQRIQQPLNHILRDTMDLPHTQTPLVKIVG